MSRHVDVAGGVGRDAVRLLSGAVAESFAPQVVAGRVVLGDVDVLVVLQVPRGRERVATQVDGSAEVADDEYVAARIEGDPARSLTGFIE